ncbi:hypothetical protein [Geomonas sp.]|uniref:hypothetical protein n=1 Tax=Geomonas sp. TaxID=2651584 RepID=UPI002B4A158B|nr:hypothetical protein [Geomonas sp.]HJV37112.1 hypothetical protein [Geomonas sp.]
MDTADFPSKGEFPYRALIRILPESLLNEVAARAIEKVAHTISNREAATAIRKAATTAITQVHSNHVQFSAETGDDYPQCGNDLGALLYWMERHHHNPGPPQPWYDLATIGLIGQVAMKVGGPVREMMTPALQAATKACTQR